MLHEFPENSAEEKCINLKIIFVVNHNRDVR